MLPSSILAHEAGYIDQTNEIIVGLQTDAPLKRAIMPNGGLRMVEGGLQAFGFKMDPAVSEIWSKYRKDHNSGVFDVYSPEIMKARKSAILTGLPDAYGRGRIIGDYRRVALYGIDALRAFKKESFHELDDADFTESVIRLREELSEQFRALDELKQMAAKYGFDIGRPAANAREAVQWTYGLSCRGQGTERRRHVDRSHLDLPRHLFRARHRRRPDQRRTGPGDDGRPGHQAAHRPFPAHPEYDQLFSGDPTWVTESIGGVGKTAVRWSPGAASASCNTPLQPGARAGTQPHRAVVRKAASGFKEYCAKVSIDTCSVQYENDELMRPYWGDDYGIACCVSAMRIGKQMQFSAPAPIWQDHALRHQRRS